MVSREGFGAIRPFAAMVVGCVCEAGFAGNYSAFAKNRYLANVKDEYDGIRSDIGYFRAGA